MKKIVLAFGIVASLLASCSGNKKAEDVVEAEQLTVVTPDLEELIVGNIVNEKGEKLDYTFNNANNTATFVLNGETINMVLDTTMASGSHYKNENYAYSEWQGVTEIKKDGKTIFLHKDDIVKSMVKDKAGKELGMTFNNTKGIATFTFNGEVLDLKQDTTASGIKYSNKDYEYTEHQGNIELKKDGAVVFSTQKE